MISYRLPLKLDEDIDKLEDLIEKFNKSQISAAELKAYRVPFGVYEQRKLGTYMVRIRCAAGSVSPLQLERIADLSQEFASGSIHLTTRQELQIHDVEFENIINVIRELEKIGMASRGGGGNTVRNIIAQEDSGIAPDEVFDVTPYAVALTSRLIAEDDSWTLPRKYKIAFSSSSEDKGYATIADLGFIASEIKGKKGFKVYAAGGMGAKPATGNILLDFIKDSEVYLVARAIKSLFWKYGNRKNKHAARLRFLWKSLGEDEFRAKFKQEYALLSKENHPPLQIEETANAEISIAMSTEVPKDTDDFKIWKKRFVNKQKQQGIVSVIVPVELGFISSKQTKALSNFLKQFGDDVIRLSKDQNFLLRNIPEDYLGNVYNMLKEILDNFNRPLIYDKLRSCAGATTCQLGICHSRALSRAIMKELRTSKMDLDKLCDIKINISGCPNACGHHWSADLGFFGKAGRFNDRLYPVYNVLAGAVIRDGQTKLAEMVVDVSAKDIPRFIKEFFEGYLSKKVDFDGFESYIQKQGKKDITQIAAKFSKIPNFDDNKNYYFDWESDKIFSLAERGKGECSAGLFDLIEVDLENIKNTRKKISGIKGEDKKDEKQQYLRQLVFYSARMLLITRGVDTGTDEQIYDAFFSNFIKTGLVDMRFSSVLKLAKDKNYSKLLEKEEDVYALTQRISFLYDHMDNAFRFVLPDEQKPPVLTEDVKSSTEPEIEQKRDKPKIVKDLRGVACPLNFVKTKMELSKIDSNEILEIWLDDGPPIENVPGSVKEEGHDILEQNKKEEYWVVIIRKK